ncbi:alpha/beta hydrolase [Streptomyces sp. NPDC006984]|uniref:alpha/beta hydrolase n=1 Tax=Streptomyces sp. NPDC006984 TaxID=3155463 RepID=UPI0033CA3183
MTPIDTAPLPTARRALLVLAVVLMMLATTGWTVVRHQKGPRTALAAELAHWGETAATGGRLPPADAAPARIAAFFHSLTPREGSRLAARYPHVVGNLNGAPVTLRYLANRAALASALAREEERVAGNGLTADGRREAARRVHRFSSLMSEDRQILAFDPSGQGRVAEVFGDLDGAERVSVVVPGVDTNVLTFQRTARRYSAPVGMARSLHAAERRAAPAVRSAVVAWADYTSPAGVGMDSATGRLAELGAVRLTAFTEALPGRSRVALFCHSYGSVVCGVAARHLPARVVDVTVAGSPGMRADNVAGLGTTARIWAARDADDWIEDVPHLAVGDLGHGEDPVAPEFGARVVSAVRAVGHTGYFEPGTDSVSNFAAIGVGVYSAVDCADGGPSCRKGTFDAESGERA